MTEIEEVSEGFDQLIEYIQRSRGFDFSAYKRTGLARRIRKRMDTVGITDYIDYMDYLEVHPDEFPELFNTILINVTSFFRDPAVWEVVASDVLPRIINERPSEAPIRVWSAACATGEEAYTIAIQLAEVLGVDAYRERAKVYATDIDDDALTTARSATYEMKQLDGIPEHLLHK